MQIKNNQGPIPLSRKRILTPTKERKQFNTSRKRRIVIPKEGKKTSEMYI